MQFRVINLDFKKRPPELESVFIRMPRWTLSQMHFCLSTISNTAVCLRVSKAPVIQQNEFNSETINTDFFARIIVCLDLDKWQNLPRETVGATMMSGGLARTICHFIFSHKMSSQMGQGNALKGLLQHLKRGKFYLPSSTVSTKSNQISTRNSI